MGGSISRSSHAVRNHRTVVRNISNSVSAIPRISQVLEECSLWERLCGSVMSKHRLQEEQEPKWPDYTWIALLVAVLLAGLVLWQGDQTNVHALLGRFEP